MTTKTVNLYEFKELSDKAKERARQWWRECESQDFGGFGELYEPYETSAKLLGIEFKRRDVPLLGGSKRSEPCIWWQLDCQGAGAAFEGTYSYTKGSVGKIRAEFPTNEPLHRIARGLAELQKRYLYQITATITTDGRDSHKYAMDLEAYGANGNQLATDAEKELLELMRDFADYIYTGIQAEYDYRMSDASIDDAMEANEYTFTADGKRED